MLQTALTDTSVAAFTVAILGWLCCELIKKMRTGTRQEDVLVTEVIQNNTRAIEQLTACLRETLARQDQKIDELLSWARRAD